MRAEMSRSPGSETAKSPAGPAPTITTSVSIISLIFYPSPLTGSSLRLEAPAPAGVFWSDISRDARPRSATRSTAFVERRNSKSRPLRAPSALFPQLSMSALLRGGAHHETVQFGFDGDIGNRVASWIARRKQNPAYPLPSAISQSLNPGGIDINVAGRASAARPRIQRRFPEYRCDAPSPSRWNRFPLPRCGPDRANLMKVILAFVGAPPPGSAP